VSYAEILSLVPIFNWGDQKKEQLKDLLNKLLVVPIEAKDIIEAYVEIETYSKGKMISRPLPAGQSAINMGKNDIWIAATSRNNSPVRFQDALSYPRLHRPDTQRPGVILIGSALPG